VSARPRGLARAVSGAILFREASRAARRWQTYALRTGFSAALLAMVLAAIWAVTNVQRLAFDPANLGQLGRGMFVGFAVVQVLLATLIAPFAVSQAIIEERDEHTMDLLALTRLTPRQILGAKVTSRVITLLTVIAGALPVLGVVVSLGGVSVVEVVSVTVHAMLTVALLGMLGGFFALFTRSPVVATMAALGYATWAYLGMPLLYGLLVFDWRAFAHFSPLLGTTATDWWALLPVLSYAPVLAVTFVLGTRLFGLRIGRAALRRYFEGDVWGATGIAWLWALLGVALLLVIPPAAAATWFAGIQKLSNPGGGGLPGWLLLAVGGAGRVVVWTWCVGLLVGLTWLYLRMGMDLVMMADDLVSGDSSRRKREARGGALRVWGNPVAWRAIRPAAWKVILPAVTTWLLVLLAVFQTGFWVVPGGLLGVGILNALAALVMTLWLAAAAIEAERRAGTLEILLTTTMATHRIVLGKLLGIAAPSFTMLALSYPMIFLGVPHLHLLFEGGERTMAFAFAAATLGCLWLTALWVAVIAVAMALAMRLRNPRAAHPASLGLLGLSLAIPPAIAAVLGPQSWVALPFRLAVPVFVARPTLWEIGLSTLGLAGLALVLLAWMALRLRAWSQHA
jgi:ABC-type transport system involved in multi-copper enzyme maturation permease subunit